MHPVPLLHEIQQRVHMRLARHDVAVERCGDVADADEQMPVGRDHGGPFHHGGGIDQRHHMAGIGAGDGFMQARQRGDMDFGHHHSFRAAISRESASTRCTINCLASSVGSGVNRISVSRVSLGGRPKNRKASSS